MPPKQRLSLHQAGGAITTTGDKATSEILRAAWEGAEFTPTDSLTHDFHAYPGRMFPFIAAQMIQAFSSLGAAVIDPFAGSGTVLVEGLAAGRAVAGIDLNPVALRIAWARTRVWIPEVVDEFEALAQSISDDAFGRARRKESIRPPDAARMVSDWYDPHVLQELSTLWTLAASVRDQDQRRLCQVVFSSLLVKVSHRASETDGRRVRKRVGRGSTSKLFFQKAHLLAQGLRELSKIVPEGTPPALFEEMDARDAPEIGEQIADLVLTSPPYPGTFDYSDHQSLRYPWFDDAPPEGELGARSDVPDRWQSAFPGWQRQERDYLRAAKHVLKPNGILVVVVGDSALAGRPLAADKCLRESADAVGLQFVASASQERPPLKGPAGDVFEGTTRKEHLVVFKNASDEES